MAMDRGNEMLIVTGVVHGRSVYQICLMLCGLIVIKINEASKLMSIFEEVDSIYIIYLFHIW